jgi:transcriptional regulator with PAS, ATPase and Fis domain
MEGELFGAERGAYTGADRSRQGLLETAADGTLFLDEIGDLPLPLQGKLLRVLEEKIVYRVGGTKGYDADFRLITATNCNLREMVHEKKFREDLFFRLNVVPLCIPPLRERREDIPLLIAHFQSCCARQHGVEKVDFSPDALDALYRYDYQGNVRELKNLVEQVTVLYPGQTIKPRQLTLPHDEGGWSGQIFESFSVEKPLKEAVHEFEERYIDKVLKNSGGNKSLASKKLGLSRKVLWEKLKK